MEKEKPSKYQEKSSLKDKALLVLPAFIALSIIGIILGSHFKKEFDAEKLEKFIDKNPTDPSVIEAKEKAFEVYSLEKENDSIFWEEGFIFGDQTEKIVKENRKRIEKLTEEVDSIAYSILEKHY